MGFLVQMSSGIISRQVLACLCISMCMLAQMMPLDARAIPSRFQAAAKPRQNVRGLSGVKFQVEQPTILTYHNGPIMTGTTSIPVYLIWYGNFSDSQRSTILDFFSSTVDTGVTTPSVSSWWKMLAGFKDMKGNGVPPSLCVQGEITDSLCAMGKNLMTADLETLVTGSLATFPADSSGVYMVLTAEDVIVQDFCSSECASHFATTPTDVTKGQLLPYGWVGNPASQCPGKCSWPFAQPEYGPYAVPLLPPNGDVGIDGTIINIASILAGTATNPFNSGFYQGDGAYPLEAATACTGMFGAGAYSGYAGQLLSDATTGDSFNAWGINDRKYLLPALWDPTSTNCTPPA